MRELQSKISSSFFMKHMYNGEKNMNIGFKFVHYFHLVKIRNAYNK